MPEKPSDSKDVADMLESIAKRIRTDPTYLQAERSAALSIIESPDGGPSLGELDVFTDDKAVTVTVETLNADATNVHVSLLEGRLVINLGEGSRACKRDLALPAAIDEDQAVATFRNGVLDVVLPLKNR